MLLRLVRPGAAGQDTRQRQPRLKLVELAGETAAAQEQIGLVLESLIKGQLLVSEQDSVDLAHEANNLARFGNPEQAVAKLQQAIAHDPNLRPELAPLAEALAAQ